jgi:DNA-binding winged helix-turn-helix (wHTH) protein
MGATEKKIFRFGVFEAVASSGELRKAGMRLRMQDQPFQVLILFLKRPGEVISREEIRHELWPSGTFVDFDHSLNTIINKIRDALGDSAADPRFIETLAKRGYRFLATVDSVSELPPGKTSTRLESEISALDTSSRSPFTLTRLEELPVVPRTRVRILFVLAQTMYLIFYIVALGRIAELQDVMERVFAGHPSITIVVIFSASIGIPVRLYLLAAVLFDLEDAGRKFVTLFPLIVILDALWALSPFLLARKIGLGLALAIVAALIYLPFGQRTLALMLERAKRSRQAEDPTIAG